MSNTLRISYSVYIKNPKRPSAHYYGRVREKGMPVMDIDLKTKEKSVAEAWARLRKSEVERYNEYVLCGEEVPTELAERIVRRRVAVATETSHRGSITLRKAVDEWEQNLRLRGMSERTIKMYTKTMGYLFKDMSIGLDTLNVDAVRTAVANQSHIAASTRHSYFVALIEFLKYASRYYGLNPMLKDEVPKVKVIHKDQPYWTMAEVAKIIDNVKCKSKLQTDCYKAYFWFLAMTGARQGEGGNVEWSDIRNGCVTFRAVNVKTGESRTVPLDWRLLDMLNRLPRRGRLVFYDIHTSQASRFSVLSKAVKAAGVRWGGLHSFRRSCSMLMYRKTSDIKGTAEILGHGAVTAMKYYQATRGVDALSELVTQAFGDERLVPDPMDRLLEADLI